MSDWIGEYAREMQVLLDKNKEAQVNSLLEKIVQRTRAEVLAACIAELGECDHLDQEDKFVKTLAPACKKCGTDIPAMLASLKRLRALQPAASALEALLREAELKGLKLAHRQHEYCAAEYCEAAKRIAELEKARALAEGKKK